MSRAEKLAESIAVLELDQQLLDDQSKRCVGYYQPSRAAHGRDGYRHAAQVTPREYALHL